MIQIISKVRIEGTYLNIVKAIYDKPTANLILNWQKQSFLLRSGIRQGSSLSPRLLNTVLEVLCTSTSKEEIESIKIGRN